jgi:acyl-CoA thioesterase-1
MPFHYRKFKSRFCHALLLALLALTAFGCQQAKLDEQAALKRSDNSSATSSPAPAMVSTKPEEFPAIVAFGDSLTAGYGLNPDDSYTVLLQQRLDKHGYRYRVINAGVSGDTSAGGARRIDWALQSGTVKFLILELGGNDGLRGLPVADMRKNLSHIIERAQARGVTVVLAGMEAPPNLGTEYTRAFRQTFRDLAKQYNTAFIPFVLEGVGGRVEMNQPDGIHPNAEGEKIFTETIWRVLEPLLTK